MCIIVVKERGIELPDYDILQNCWDSNPHGAGYMYFRDGSVHIRKGFMKLEDLIESFDAEKITKNDNLVIHFRISTSGKIDGGNTHPFPVIRDMNLLRNTSVICNVGIAHNGIIHIPLISRVHNDTQSFIYKVLADEKVFPFLDDTDTHDIITKHIPHNRFAMMREDKIVMIGTGWINDEGIDYSNDGYLPWFSNSYDFLKPFDNEEEEENIMEKGGYDNWERERRRGLNYKNSAFYDKWERDDRVYARNKSETWGE